MSPTPRPPDCVPDHLDLLIGGKTTPAADGTEPIDPSLLGPDSSAVPGRRSRPGRVGNGPAGCTGHVSDIGGNSYRALIPI